MQYHVIMVDYGPNYIGKQGPSGFEALPVQPELSHRQIVEQVADVLACDHRALVHVKQVDGNYVFDVTAELCEEAGQPDAPLSPADRIAFNRDHAYDLRKHGERVA